jgi:hypothetical protein
MAVAGYRTFNTNTVILLAAVFLALLFAFALNSLARRTLWCGGRAADDGGGNERASTSSSDGGVRGGIKKRTPRIILGEVYVAAKEEEARAEAEDVCGRREGARAVAVLPRCVHGFHVSCVDA